MLIAAYFGVNSFSSSQLKTKPKNTFTFPLWVAVLFSDNSWRHISVKRYNASHWWISKDDKHRSGPLSSSAILTAFSFGWVHKSRYINCPCRYTTWILEAKYFVIAYVHQGFFSQFYMYTLYEMIAGRISPLPPHPLCHQVTRSNLLYFRDIFIYFSWCTQYNVLYFP